MAGKEHNKKSQTFSCKVVTLVLISSTALWFILCVSDRLKWVHRESILDSVKQWDENMGTSEKLHKQVGSQTKPCNYSYGRWVHDPGLQPRYDHRCKEIFRGWNCISNNKSNARDILKWRWQPWECDLPRLDPEHFLQDFRDTSIGFVGDSLNRNMFVSLVCTLRQASDNLKKWRPARADRGFTFLQYNVTLAYHRTNLLARYGRWSALSQSGALEQLGYKEGFRVDVDVPDGTWVESPSYHDVLIMNTGHWWWAPTKFDPVKSPMLFFEKGKPILPLKTPEEGLDMVLKNMINFVEKTMPKSGLKFFRTQSPRHFEGGDWNQGGTCHRSQPLQPEEVENLFGIESHSPNTEVRLVNGHLQKALQSSSFHLLDITYMSEFRADAHPSTSGGKKHEDCMHWCLPGITDYWNDLFMYTLLKERINVS